MASLSGELKAVIEALPQSISPGIISKYNQTISNNAGALDEVAKGATLMDRAAMASKFSRTVFGDFAVFPQEVSYTEKQQENW
jgi:hypothetical protein